jgi:hypothetical protein
MSQSWVHREEARNLTFKVAWQKLGNPTAISELNDDDGCSTWFSPENNTARYPNNSFVSRLAKK